MFASIVVVLAMIMKSLSVKGFTTQAYLLNRNKNYDIISQKSPSSMIFKRRHDDNFSSQLLIPFISSSASVSLHVSQEQDQDQSSLLEFDDIQTSVLKQVYPSLLEYINKYGHPNIPLGTPEGGQCRILRRLHIQKKLTDKEVDWLTSINFRFNSLEDVYFEVDFQDMLQTLLEYEAEYHTNYQVPKKFEPNPELGAWVTGIRRLYNNPSDDKYLDPQHVKDLNAIGFSWQSARKCGSKFMKQYRDLKARVEDSEETLQDILDEESTQKWIKLQQNVYHKGDLSETRTTYLSQLLKNDDWMNTTY